MKPRMAPRAWRGTAGLGLRKVRRGSTFDVFDQGETRSRLDSQRSFFHGLLESYRSAAGGLLSSDRVGDGGGFWQQAAA